MCVCVREYMRMTESTYISSEINASTLISVVSMCTHFIPAAAILILEVHSEVFKMKFSEMEKDEIARTRE